MNMTYIEINRKIAKVTHELRMLRMTSVLKTLNGLKKKTKQIKELEEDLNKERNKTLQDFVAIDELLTEFESVL